MVSGHEIVQGHEQDPVTAEPLYFFGYIDQICPYCPVLDEVAELEDIGVLGIQGEEFAILYALVVVDHDVHAGDDVLILAKIIPISHLDERHLDYLPTVGSAVVVVRNLGPFSL